jgi:acetyl esterase/lipase
MMAMTTINSISMKAQGATRREGRCGRLMCFQGAFNGQNRQRCRNRACPRVHAGLAQRTETLFNRIHHMSLLFIFRPVLRLLSFFRLAFVALAMAGAASAADAPIMLWPDVAPGDKGDLGEERDTTKPTDGKVAGQTVQRIGNVSKPTLTIYRAPKEKNTGAAVLVCPGGAYNILALDLEGTEVCEWLNSIGVTAALLKYRVPRRAGLEKHAAALQDAQRAFSLLRHRAGDLGIDPQRMGVLGFSAGGHLAATFSTTAERSYPVVDDADKVKLRPDFTVLIYPAYLTVKEQNDAIAPELHVTTNTPPTFICIAQDDAVRMENALFYALALKQAKVPVELHLYPTGGHGYGLRRTGEAVAAWPDRAGDWLRMRGWLGKK